MPSYAKLNPTGQKRVDAQAEKTFAEKADQFEHHMGPRLFASEPVREVVEEMMGRVANIVDAYAKHIGRSKSDVYQEEFRFREGDVYYGAFHMTADNVRKVLHETATQPLRLQLKLIYNAVRNNNLAKWLKLAADDLQRATGKVLVEHKARSGAQVRELSPGFAKDSGLSKVLDKNPQLRADVARAAAREKKKVKLSDGKDAEVHQAIRSGVMNASPVIGPTREAKRYRANDGMPLSEQETVHRSDLELTVPEIQQLKRNKDKNYDLRSIDDAKQQRFNAKGNKAIPWEQGREAIDVFPNSEVERQASAIHARLDAGISGSTDLMMHAARNLGMTSDSQLRKVRLALLGWMLSNRDHSFYEIMYAAEGYGPAFVKTDPKTGKGHPRPAYFYEAPENFKPYDVKRLKSLLPENEFPGWFLSGQSKEALAQQLQHADLSYGEIGTDLRQKGLPLDVLVYMANQHDRDAFAFLEVLDGMVAGAGFMAGSTPVAERKNRWVRRALRRSAPFLHLIHKYPLHADLMLSTLIHHHHPGAETKDDLLAVAGAAALAPIQMNPKGDALRQTLVARGVPQGLAEDDRACPGFIVEHLLRLDGLVAGSGFVVGGANGAMATNQQKLAELRSTRLWADICKFFGEEVDAEGGRAVLILSSFMHKRYQGLESLVFQPSNPERIYALGKGVPDIAIRGFRSADLALLRGLLDDIDAIASGAGDAGAKRAALSNLENLPKHKAIKGKLRTWFLAVVAGVARTASIDLSGDPKLQLAADTAELVRPGAMSIDGKQLAGMLDKKHRDWNMFPARLMMDENLRQHRNDPPSTAKTALLNSAKPLEKLSDAELHGINQYTKLAGMGHWQTALRKRDYDPTKDQMDTLGGAMTRMKAAVSGLNRLPVYSPGPTYCGKALPASLDTKNQAVAKRYLAQHYPIGKVLTQGNFLSSSKSREQSFAYSKNGFDLMWIISNIKTGKDVQLVSHKEDEEEVLFPPGWRFIVTGVDYKPATSDCPPKLWVYVSEI